MGCDIHAYLEKQVNGKWLLHNEKKIGRDYNLFAFMVGVRVYQERSAEELIKPVSKPRGLPKDVSHSVREASKDWGDDGHSHSWLNLEELKEVEQRLGVWKSYSNSWFESNKEPPLPTNNRVIKLTKNVFGEPEFFVGELPIVTHVSQDLNGVIKEMKMVEEGGNKTRLVFWFDN